MIAGLVILGALGFLFYKGLTSATEYFKTANQAVADRAKLGTQIFRMEGTVEPGVRQVGKTVHFSIVANQVAVAVISTGSPPQLFKVGVPVVLVGHWENTTYMSDQIMVKHTASYVESHPNRLKSQLPSTTTPG
ncbi:MAG: cytochrome c maturation protein CcmE [Acidimicrobiales bacterium]